MSLSVQSDFVARVMCALRASWNFIAIETRIHRNQVKKRAQVEKDNQDFTPKHSGIDEVFVERSGFVVQ